MSQELLFCEYNQLKKQRVSIIKQTQQKLREMENKTDKIIKQLEEVNQIENTEVVQILHNVLMGGIRDKKIQPEAEHRDHGVSNKQRSKDKYKSNQLHQHYQYNHQHIPKRDNIGGQIKTSGHQRKGWNLYNSNQNTVKNEKYGSISPMNSPEGQKKKVSPIKGQTPTSLTNLQQQFQKNLQNLSTLSQKQRKK